MSKPMEKIFAPKPEGISAAPSPPQRSTLHLSIRFTVARLA